MKSIYKIASFLIVMVLVASPIISMAAGPGFGGGVNDGGNACAAPIDGGLSLLIAAGIGYGAKKLHKKTAKEQHLEK